MGGGRGGREGGKRGKGEGRGGEAKGGRERESVLYEPYHFSIRSAASARVSVRPAGVMVTALHSSSSQFWCLYHHLHDYVAYLHLSAQLSRLKSSQVQILLVPSLANNLGQVFRTHASVTKQYELVPVKGR